MKYVFFMKGNTKIGMFCALGDLTALCTLSDFLHKSEQMFVCNLKFYGPVEPIGSY